MIAMDSLEEMAALLPAGVCAWMGDVLAELASHLDGPREQASFTDLFGSPAFLVEAVEDLGFVRSFEEGASGRLSVLEAPSEWFDIARWAEDGAFAVLGTIETSDGGPVYYIPASVTDLVPNVAESIRRKAAAG